MAGLRADHYRGYIGGKDKFRIVRTVEEKEKFMLRMILYNAFQGFMSKPSDAFQFSFQ
ncbi:hypothetical protein D3C87_1633740 [compost metagenome]